METQPEVKKDEEKPKEEEEKKEETKDIQKEENKRDIKEISDITEPDEIEDTPKNKKNNDIPEFEMTGIKNIGSGDKKKEIKSPDQNKEHIDSARDSNEDDRIINKANEEDLKRIKSESVDIDDINLDDEEQYDVIAIPKSTKKTDEKGLHVEDDGPKTFMARKQTLKWLDEGY